MGHDSNILFEENSHKRHAFIPSSARIECNKLINCTRFVLPSRESKIQKNAKFTLARSAPDLTPINNKKTNYVQLYKPIYIARYTKTIEGQFVYDEGNEFELIEEIDEEYLHVIHLRTNIEYKIHQKCLQLDPETSLRLGSTDRGVIQRCLFQYNIPALILNRRNAEDWHYLICVNPLNHCFYFAQESKLNHILFKSFHELIHNENVLKTIPLSIKLPFRIEFEEDLWHIPRRHLTFEYCIGEGEFGEV
ncbi:unnamed protein product [Rotaria sordida]|uniref:Uncharacterized protein n=1 Tax=Rotaria sordida TaxID=392033 RepID=A0A813W257_9BILA|nr:unnamed protein product [Rotaria sordida]CAF0854440.1 unnamed protein product [Rotaria sordida]